MALIPPELIREILEEGLGWLRYENETSLLFPQGIPASGELEMVVPWWKFMPRWKRCLRRVIMWIGGG